VEERVPWRKTHAATSNPQAAYRGEDLGYKLYGSDPTILKTGDRFFTAALNLPGIKPASSTFFLSELLSLVFSFFLFIPYYRGGAIKENSTPF